MVDQAKANTALESAKTRLDIAQSAAQRVGQPLDEVTLGDRSTTHEVIFGVVVGLVFANVLISMRRV